MARFVDGQTKLGFFATLPLPDIAGSVAEIERSLDGLKADGIILLTHQNGVHVGDPTWDEVYSELDRRGAAVLIHPTRPTYASDLKLRLWQAILEYPFETTRVAANLIYNGVIAKFPNIKWILAHAGGCLPYLRHRLELMEETDEHSPSFSERHPEGIAPSLAQFWYDTAIAGSESAMSSLYRVADPAKVMFGSDWPYIRNEDILRQTATIERCVERTLLDLLVSRNASSLFRRLSLA
jgi:aminocarboxymuconate-semialdehyde decarboxylase